MGGSPLCSSAKTKLLLFFLSFDYIKNLQDKVKTLVCNYKSVIHLYLLSQSTLHAHLLLFYNWIFFLMKYQLSPGPMTGTVLGTGVVAGSKKKMQDLPS